VDATEQRVSDHRTLINIERKSVSNQSCSIRCHDPSLPNRTLDGQDESDNIIQAPEDNRRLRRA